MELKWLEDFLCLSQHLNFSRAANERHVTQSALSRRIRQLEAWVGVPLIDRSTYPIRLTLAGQSFLLRAHDAVGLLTHARDELSARYTPMMEVLSFATLNTLSLTFFPALMARIESNGDNFRTRFSDPHPSFLGNVSTLLNGNCDFLLTYAHPLVSQMEDLRNFPYLSLGHEKVIPVSAADAAGEPLHRLGNHTLPTEYLRYRDTTFFAQVLDPLVERRGLNLNMVYENGMAVGLKAMAVSGQGVAWIPQSLMPDEWKRGILVRAGVQDYDLDVEIRVYRSQRFRTDYAERFWRRASALAAEDINWWQN
ncbi:LysR family transcriptional regulator [Pseudochrobactrum sp. B5]|uniref:LysR family transcriptional regulator n=1 Tax=Pseudochrobactrum sp. B5 TaxID=1289478 RepID=UPI000953294B|nr:LysR family transcriptional regulator [Pseudochrobactrum sp. B5]